MVNIIAAVIIVFCVVVVIYGLRVYKENRSMMPKKRIEDDED